MNRKCAGSKKPFTCTCSVPENPLPGYKDVRCDLLQLVTVVRRDISRSRSKYGTNFIQLLFSIYNRGREYSFDDEPLLTSPFIPIAFVKHANGKSTSVFGKAKVGRNKYEWVEIRIPKSNGLVYIKFILHKNRTRNSLIVVSTPTAL